VKVLEMTTSWKTMIYGHYQEQPSISSSRKNAISLTGILQTWARFFAKPGVKYSTKQNYQLGDTRVSLRIEGSTF
jgi:hypothetical protein